ncbi:MAG TPA: site-2 protease family protein [Pirellulaceae bacterium]|nr:site-2 protease family protein [Pirellulaceae bacterium]
MVYRNCMTEDRPSLDNHAPDSRTTAEVLTAEVSDEWSQSSTASVPPPRLAPEPRKRRVRLPLILLFLTCLSTFWVGANHWFPTGIYLFDDTQNPLLARQMVLAYWDDGLLYMTCVLGILLAHEMGHFIATVCYGIPASLPFVIPMPFMPLGTFGAVIGMDGRRADRKEIFDIGLAGPLAGLVVAIPIMIWGIMTLDLSLPRFGQFEFHNPLLVEMLLRWIKPAGFEPGMTIAVSQLNPFFMAGWVGLLVTGLNMMPVSQLDGGHVIYTLFGRRSRWIARGFVLLAIGYITYTIIYTQEMSWILMLGLILLIGIDHPPTRDDSVKLGWFRYVLGIASLAIPVLCFAPQAIGIAK